jgi:hypothetical protein
VAPWPKSELLRIAGQKPLGQVQQGQLWIVDPQRTGAPVDFGVLAPSSAEHFVPTKAHLPIGPSSAFVFTAKANGGEVVATRTDVVAEASLKPCTVPPAGSA